jgi:UPF0042 nucleotide-binding protein
MVDGVQEGSRAARFVVLTGLSGAGKTTGLHALEDLGYFTADNVPPVLWPQLFSQVQRTGQERLAVGVDVRTREHLAGVGNALQEVRALGVSPEIVFLDASDDVLVKRYNLTRRTHPLGHAPLSSDIAQERRALGPLRASAEVLLDTSNFSARQLTEELWERFGEDRRFRLRLMSFGFKRGVPIDADNVFDLRALPNPFYEESLRTLDGRDEAVQSYIFTPDGLVFYTELCSFAGFLSTQAAASGRSSYTIAVGCTGGQHRSVAVVERLSHDLAERFAVRVEHRDMELALKEYHGS